MQALLRLAYADTLQQRNALLLCFGLVQRLVHQQRFGQLRADGMHRIQ